MPIQCKFHAKRSEKPEPGDMWYAPHLLVGDVGEFYLNHKLSDQYKRDWMSKRPPLMVRLPNGIDCLIDTRVDGETTGWDVTGEAPIITMHPSVNLWPGNPRGWHGWLQNGVLSDDLEGRKYDTPSPNAG